MYKNVKEYIQAQACNFYLKTHQFNNKKNLKELKLVGAQLHQQNSGTSRYCMSG